MSFRIVPLDDATAAEVRETLRTPVWGYPAIAQTAAGYGPCRACLRMFDIGVERRILFTYDPFEGREPYPQPGPVFIHESPCRPYAEAATFPDELRPLAFTLNAYGRGRKLRAQELVAANGPLDELLETLLSREDVDYIHVHNTEVGCFVLRVEHDDDHDHAN
jgi:hypothetical protein